MVYLLPLQIQGMSINQAMEDLIIQPTTQNLGVIKECLINTAFVVGIIGNIAALWILHKSAKTRNSKHVLMLTCLAINDLVAEVGMLIMLNLKKYDVLAAPWICVAFIFLRSFGVTSGCVALVMAVERWLALTRPFVYQQLVTYQVIKKSILYLWLVSLIWTHLPIIGFGLYYENNNCARYRDATELKDIVYAYLFLTVGTTLVLMIALCNISVICELLRIRSRGKILIRRVSRSTITNRVDGCAYQTPEEIAFAKLMAILCIIFIVCWAPQMISIPMVRFHWNPRVTRAFGRLADFLMCVYFTLDPYVYVIYQYMENGKWRNMCCKRQTSSNLPTPATTPTSVLLNPPSYTGLHQV